MRASSIARRFQPSRRDNPKGRPKGSKNFSTLFSEELAQLVTLTENGKRAGGVGFGEQKPGALLTGHCRSRSSLCGGSLKGGCRYVDFLKFILYMPC